MEELEEMGAYAGSPLDGCIPQDSSSAVEMSAAQVELCCHNSARRLRKGLTVARTSQDAVLRLLRHSFGVYHGMASNAPNVARH